MQDQENKEKNAGKENGRMKNETDTKTDNIENADETSGPAAAGESGIGNDTISSLEAKVSELNEKYLRLYSEFDNYRKRSLKERVDLIKTASEDVFKAILPVIDDFERAIKANEKTADIASVNEGVQLIYNKLKNISQQKGLTSFDSVGEDFNPDLMEAITHVPAPEPSQKGKVIDEIEKGYKLGEKVIRYARVVVGQ